MHWILISGSWRTVNQQVEHDVRHTVNQLLGQGKGIITGGALGVDYIATDEVIRSNPVLEKLQVFLPTTLAVYIQHYLNRAQEGVITASLAQELISQLNHIHQTNPATLHENPQYTVVNQETYYLRNTAEVQAADELVAFHINHSAGVQDIIDKARQRHLPVTIHSYQIPTNDQNKPK